MTTYSILLDPHAIEDIQKAIDYYEEQQSGLGQRFENELDQHLRTLEKNPMFGIRYDDIRCLPLNKFPYMVHFTVDKVQQVVAVRAVFHTSLDPDRWKER